MVAQPSPAHTLHELLQRMDATCRKLEEVVLGEQQAVRQFDSAALIALTDVRHVCHQELQAMEAACRDIVRQHAVPDDLSLEAFIDMNLQDAAPGLQSLRRKLYQRLANLNQSNEDNRLRLRAAYDVTSGVLQNIGLQVTKSTYGPGGAL